MKFINITNQFKILLVIIFIAKIIATNLDSKKFLFKNKVKSSTSIESDSILVRVRQLIHEISNSKLKSENLSIKKKIAGALPEGYPEEMIKNAKKMRYDKKAWSPLMSFPTEIWRFCIFPMFKLNYKTYCNNQFSTGTPDEINGK